MIRRPFHLRASIPCVLVAAGILLAAPQVLRSTSCEASGEKALFKEGRTLVTQGRYEQAIPVLEELLRQYPRGPHASRACFFLAKARVGTGELDLARELFQRTLRDYPDSLEAHKSRYKIGLVRLWQGRTGEALEIFRDMAARPDGPLAPEAGAMATYLEGFRK